MKRELRLAAISLIAFTTLGTVAQERADTSSDAISGKEILSRFVEVNRYWLVGPPATVRQFSYTLGRTSGTQEFAVTDARRATRAKRQGVTYSSILHHIATRPESVTVRTVVRENGQTRLTLGFDPAVKGACGNGVENSWIGYFGVGGDSGYLVLDTQTFVPVEAGIGSLTESFAEFVSVDSAHFVPLTIVIQKEEMRFEWHFRLYDPGLWLFDESHYGGRRVAWVENVTVNQETPVLREAVAASLKRQTAETAGSQALVTFLDANRTWLLPSMAARRGLAYEYRQEFPYLERVLFDPDGNVMVQLVASKESPDNPTRQKLWLSDGRSINGDARDPYVVAQPSSAGDTGRELAAQHRLVQNLAMGLGWECALTRIAREPEAFWFEKLPGETSNRYRLIAHSRKDTRLFAGTMLAFTSWAYMHDVRFSRSEIECDAGTHQPLAERDFDSNGVLKGEFLFGDWITSTEGSVPGRIRAVIPHQEDGADRSLEMDARFQVAAAGVWLLNRVESRFRGSQSGSTGVVSVVPAKPEFLSHLGHVRDQLRHTEQLLASMHAAPEGRLSGVELAGEWRPWLLKSHWNAQALKAAQDAEHAGQGNPLIGIHRARIERADDGVTRVVLEGISTTAWKEFETVWRLGWQDSAGQPLGTAVTTNVLVRAENVPAPFEVKAQLPPVPENSTARLFVESTVRRLTAAYHGHGVWMSFMDDE